MGEGAENRFGVLLDEMIRGEIDNIQDYTIRNIASEMKSVALTQAAKSELFVKLQTWNEEEKSLDKVYRDKFHAKTKNNILQQRILKDKRRYLEQKHWYFPSLRAESVQKPRVGSYGAPPSNPQTQYDNFNPSNRMMSPFTNTAHIFMSSEGKITMFDDRYIDLLEYGQLDKKLKIRRMNGIQRQRYSELATRINFSDPDVQDFLKEHENDGFELLEKNLKDNENAVKMWQSKKDDPQLAGKYKEVVARRDAIREKVYRLRNGS